MCDPSLPRPCVPSLPVYLYACLSVNLAAAAWLSAQLAVAGRLYKKQGYQHTTGAKAGCMEAGGVWELPAPNSKMCSFKQLGLANTCPAGWGRAAGDYSPVGTTSCLKVCSSY